MSKEAIKAKGESQSTRVYPNTAIGGNLPSNGLVTRNTTGGLPDPEEKK